MLWLKAWHLIAVVSWFAGLFYLPRLFVYHAMTDDEVGRARFEVMAGCGHWPQYEDPKTFNRLHLDFLLGRA